MGVREKHSPRCQAIDMRSFRLGMPAENADPVVEVVNSDEQYITPINCLSGYGSRHACQ